MQRCVMRTELSFRNALLQQLTYIGGKVVSFEHRAALARESACT